MVEKGIAGEVFPGPGVSCEKVGGGEVYDLVDDFWVEGLEEVEVVLKMQRLGLFLKSLVGLENDEVVDFGGEFVEADFGPVHLGADEEEVVDFSSSIAGCVRIESTGLAEIDGFLEWEEAMCCLGV